MNNLFLFILLLLSAGAGAQTRNRIQADSVHLYQVGGSAELILENSTKERTGGFLANKENGRTEYRYALDSAWLDSAVLKIRRGEEIQSFNLVGIVPTLYSLDGTINAIRTVTLGPDGQLLYGANEDGASMTSTWSKNYIAWLMSNSTGLTSAGQETYVFDNYAQQNISASKAGGGVSNRVRLYADDANTGYLELRSGQGDNETAIILTPDSLELHIPTEAAVDSIAGFVGNRIVKVPFKGSHVDSLTNNDDTVRWYKDGSSNIVGKFPSKDSVYKNPKWIDFLYWSKIQNNPSIVYKQVLIDSAPAFAAFGDSYLTSGTSSATKFPTVIANVLKGSVTTYAVPAGTINHQVYRARKNQSYKGKDFTIILAGLNDVVRAAGTPQGYTQIRNGFRSFIADAFLDTAIAANNAAITYGGTWVDTWTGADSAALKAPNISGGKAMLTYGSGATASYSFSGNSLVLGFASTDGSYMVLDNFTVTIDGVSRGTYTFDDNLHGINDNAGTIVKHNTKGPAVLVWTSLSSGAHTVVITKGSNTTKALIFDYIGHLQNPTRAMPVIVAGSPYAAESNIVSNWGAQFGSLAYRDSVDKINQVIIDQVNIFQGYPISYVDINDFFKAPSDFTSDSIHPNTSGHEHLAQAFLSAIAFKPSVSAGGISLQQLEDSLNEVRSEIPVGGVTYSHHAITYSSTPVLDLANGTSQEITLTGNITLSYANITDGAFVALKVIEDGTGGHSVSLPAGTLVNGALTTTAGAINVIAVWKAGSQYLATIGLYQ